MIATTPFGRTGHESTRAIFGAASLSKVSRREADQVLDLLLEHGVNHIDTAASYGDSELRIASWLKRVPETFFLATKTDEREYGPAKEEFHRSLERLGVDQVDLIQLHNLVDVIEWELALREGGALEAAIEARDEGLARFGRSRHGPARTHNPSVGGSSPPRPTTIDLREWVDPVHAPNTDGANRGRTQLGGGPVVDVISIGRSIVAIVVSLVFAVRQQKLDRKLAEIEEERRAELGP